MKIAFGSVTMEDFRRLRPITQPKGCLEVGKLMSRHADKGLDLNQKINP